MAKGKKMTARKSVGGVVKRVQLLPVSDRVLRSRTTSRSPSAAPSPATGPPHTPPPIDVDMGEGGEDEEGEEEEEDESQSDDVRLFFLKGFDL